MKIESKGITGTLKEVRAQLESVFTRKTLRTLVLHVRVDSEIGAPAVDPEKALALECERVFPGSKINQIKLVRERTGKGLNEAKAWVEANVPEWRPL